LEPNGLLVEEQAASITAADDKTAAVSKWRMGSIGVSYQPATCSGEFDTGSPPDMGPHHSE
jgi:hypothetical protein